MRRILLLGLIAASLPGASLAAQAGSIGGTVTSQDGGRPLAGATVSLGGTNIRTVTRPDGTYTLTVPPGTHQVTAAVAGHASATRTATVAAGGSATLDFQLVQEALQLEGLVVSVGYGERERQQVTGAVETVTPEDFNTGRVVSAEQLIQAKVAGVQVLDTGEPGGGMNMRVRGGTSITSSNEPLFVVDGVPLPVGGGLSAGRNPLNFLNPEDIESITVLKDASSTAIYGSRGANGVVLVETRSGTRGPQFTYSGSFSTSQVTRRPDLMNAEEFRAAVSRYAPEKVSVLGSASTDWYDAILRDGQGQEHTLAMAGRGEGMNYRLSVGYLDQEGVVQGSGIERLTVGLNYNHTLFGDRLSVQASARGARTEDLFTPNTVLGDAGRFAPTQPIENGSSFFEWSQFPLGPNNPVASLRLAQEDGTTYRSIGSLEAEYRLPFIEGLSATTRLGYDVASSERRTFNPTIQQSQVEAGLPGFFSRSTPNETNGLVDAYLTLDRRLDALSSDIDATAGYSYEAFSGETPLIEARGLATDLLGPNGLPTAQELTPRIDNVRESRLASFFARVNLSALDRYLLTLSVRRDGSSRFGPDNQWGTFPAAAVGWRLIEEPFLQAQSLFSELKLRASWGKNGNQSFGDYLWISAYRPGDAQTQVQFGDEFVGTIRPSAVDPNIKWEETTSINLGLDYGLLDNRFTGSLEYYTKETDDLIFRIPVAAGTNLSNFVTTNVGSVENSGFEATLNTMLLDGGRRGLSWEMDFNAAYNTNKLTRVNAAGGSEQILVGGISGGVGTNIQVLQPGFPVYSFFVYRHKRDAAGNPLYADANGDGNINETDLYEDLNGDNTINQSDRSPFESPAPDWILGHTSTLTLGSIDLSTTLRAYLGNYVYNNIASNRGNFRELTATGSPENLHRSALEYGFATPQYFSDVYVEDASFLRMDNLTLGFTVPQRFNVQQARIFATIQNVFTLTGYSGVDPSAMVVGTAPTPNTFGIDNNIYPRSRTFTVGVSVGF